MLPSNVFFTKCSFSIEPAVDEAKQYQTRPNKDTPGGEKEGKMDEMNGVRGQEKSEMRIADRYFLVNSVTAPSFSILFFER